MKTIKVAAFKHFSDFFLTQSHDFAPNDFAPVFSLFLFTFLHINSRPIQLFANKNFEMYPPKW